MIDITKNIGADIPFFLVNKTVRAEGIGEKISEIDNNVDFKLILIKPNFGINTGIAYKNISKLKEKKTG
jgi:4-diphosphocytidyl-2-C-methyl-D-erythritol kinase